MKVNFVSGVNNYKPYQSKYNKNQSQNVQNNPSFGLSYKEVVKSRNELETLALHMDVPFKKGEDMGMIKAKVDQAFRDGKTYSTWYYDLKGELEDVPEPTESRKNLWERLWDL